MKCVNCSSPEPYVLDTRENQDGTLRRRRKCPVCQTLFTTLEVEMEKYREMESRLDFFEQRRFVIDERIEKFREELKASVGSLDHAEPFR